MKKVLITASIAITTLIIACGNSGNSDNGSNDSALSSASDTIPSASSTDITANPDYQNGLALIAKSDCLTCHKIEEKLIGPPYKDVANKYAGVDTAVRYLSHKVITGGSGVWGPIAMTPHASLSQADAEQMVKYVLLLKNQ